MTFREQNAEFITQEPPVDQPALCSQRSARRGESLDTEAMKRRNDRLRLDLDQAAADIEKRIGSLIEKGVLVQRMTDNDVVPSVDAGGDSVQYTSSTAAGSPVVTDTESFPKEQPPSLYTSPDEDYTSEQWKAFEELEQAEMLCEFRRLEIALAEERSKSAQLQKIFAIELMAQKDAHSRDVRALEDMVGKVLNENKRLSGLVEKLCGDVNAKPLEMPGTGEATNDSIACTTLSSAHEKNIAGMIAQKCLESPCKDTMPTRKGSFDADASTDCEHLATSSSDGTNTDSTSAFLIVRKDLGDRKSFAYVNVD